MGNPTKESSTGTVQAPDQMTTLQGLLALLSGGGQTVTSSPGDTAALQQLLAQMRGVNPADQLAAIFQQAQGAIPKFQVAYSNAVGARSGNNSAIASSLQDLLKATTIEAQNNFAQQQNQNFATQAQAGNAIVNATKGQTQTTKANTMTGSPIGDLTALIGLLKAGTQLTGTKTVGEMFDKFTGTSSAPAPAPATQPAAVTSVSPAAAMMGPSNVASDYSLPDSFNTYITAEPQSYTPDYTAYNPVYGTSFTPDYSLAPTPAYGTDGGMYTPDPAAVVDFTKYFQDPIPAYTPFEPIDYTLFDE